MLGEKADLTLSKIIPKISESHTCLDCLQVTETFTMGLYVYVCVCIVLIYTHAHIQVNPLFKNSLYARSFLQKPWNNTCFTNQMKSEEDLHFYKKRWKQKQHSTFIFAGAVRKGESTMSSNSGTAKLIPRITLSISASSHHTSELCLRGSVLYLTIYFL